MEYRTSTSRAVIGLNTLREACSQQGMQVSEAAGMVKHGNEKGAENGGADLKSVRRSVSSNDTRSFPDLLPSKKKVVLIQLGNSLPPNWFLSKKFNQHQPYGRWRDGA